MSQTQAPETATESISTQRINFSDGNRALHVQALFKWLPEELHDAPGIDWTSLPSAVIAYLVNTVGKSPWACSLALAAAVGRGAMGEQVLQKSVGHLNRLLRDVQRLCGSTHCSQLTKRVWEVYVSQKELIPGDICKFRVYSAFTESHFPEHLERLTPQERGKLAPYVPPRLPRRFLKQHFPESVRREEEKQRRKGKSDVLAPLHSLLVALVRFRKQSASRLLTAYQEALSQAKRAGMELPLAFSYEEELVTVNRDARTVVEVQLEKHPVTLHFLLWDRRTWVLKHPNDYGVSTKSKADSRGEEFAEPQFFVECLNPTSELLWFGDLIRYRLFQASVPQNMPKEDIEMRLQLLSELGTTTGLVCRRPGILTPTHELTNALSHAITRTGALVFDVESLCRGVLFASALATIALTNGSRMCELLQMSADRFKVRPYVVSQTGEERVMHLQFLLPKGKRTEAERKLFPISEWSWELLREIAVELKRAHQGRIPVVHPRATNTKAEDLSPERYLFQWDASPDGKSGAFYQEDVTSLLRFMLHGLDLYTAAGQPIRVSVHILRHVMSTHARHYRHVPAEAIAYFFLHHRLRELTGRDPSLPEISEYYTLMTEEQRFAIIRADLDEQEEMDHALLAVAPSPHDLQQMNEDLRIIFDLWHALHPTALGYCGCPGLCPREADRSLCLGCSYLITDPERLGVALSWRDSYAKQAELLEAQGNSIDARQARIKVQLLDDVINVMRLQMQAEADGSYIPLHKVLPSPHRKREEKP